MAVKTITVTEEAYHALARMKDKNESFSRTILRIAGKRSLREFVGILSKESGKRLEMAIKEGRKLRAEADKKRRVWILKAYQGH